jgi:molybdopterin-guanine dinucleotide biosynthesis protein A
MPFPLLIRKDTLPIVREKLQAGCLKMKDLLNALDTKWMIITDEGPFKNINRTDDLLR